MKTIQVTNEIKTKREIKFKIWNKKVKRMDFVEPGKFLKWFYDNITKIEYFVLLQFVGMKSKEKK